MTLSFYFPPPLLADAVHKELQGESILWAGQPQFAAYLQQKNITVRGCIFLACVLAFGAWKLATGSWDPSPQHGFDRFAFLIFGFVIGGAALNHYFLPLWDVMGDGRLFYVVTENRAVIFHQRWSLHIESFENPSFERVSGGGSSGSIILKRIYTRGAKGGPHVEEIGFLGLASYAGAERALHEMKQRHAAPAA